MTSKNKVISELISKIEADRDQEIVEAARSYSLKNMGNFENHMGRISKLNIYIRQLENLANTSEQVTIDRRPV